MIVKAISRGKELETVLIEGNLMSYKTHATLPTHDLVKINTPKLEETIGKCCLVVDCDGTSYAIYNSVVYIINKEGKTIDKIIV